MSPNFNKKPAFINRNTELQFLKNWINQSPEQLLFIFGPKSSGKTTLLMRFIDKHLQNKQFDIKHFNLRKMLIANYKDFVQSFFEMDYGRSSKEHCKRKKEYNLKVFKMTNETLKDLENKRLDPFVVMNHEIEKLCQKGKRPIIIIDELQALEDIYLNGQRQLLKELFNFFVAITKESHLCHVIIASSDGYFMKRIYEDSKLTKTSDFFEVDYLNEQDAKYWLSNLEKESAIVSYKLSQKQINLIWDYLGGSLWEISDVLGKLIAMANNKKIADPDLMQVIERHITIVKGRFFHYARINPLKKALLDSIFAIQKQTNEFNESNLQHLVNKDQFNETRLTDELITLVRLNYLSFNPVTSSYKLQGHSMYYGLKSFLGL